MQLSREAHDDVLAALAPAGEYRREDVSGYLDTASYGLPPRSAVAATERALADWQQRVEWERWEEDGERCRELFAALVGARPLDIALVPAVSVAAGLVAASLPAARGDNVVVYEREFTSNLFPWLALEERGVEVRLRPLEALADAVDGRTALVAVSAVQSATGAVADLAALKETGARLFVDATHAVAAVPLDARGADYVAAAAYKWLLCPRGVGFLYVRPERLAEVQPWTAGWKSRREPYGNYYAPPRDLAEDARRLDVSLPWLLMPGARSSLELLAGIGIERIAAHDLELARRFAAELGRLEPSSPIVHVDVGNADEAVRRLRAVRVTCAARAGAIRLSFHLYNSDVDVDLALEAIAPVHAGG